MYFFDLIVETEKNEINWSALWPVNITRNIICSLQFFYPGFFGECLFFYFLSFSIIFFFFFFFLFLNLIIFCFFVLVKSYGRVKWTGKRENWNFFFESMYDCPFKVFWKCSSKLFMARNYYFLQNDKEVSHVTVFLLQT